MLNSCNAKGRVAVELWVGVLSGCRESVGRRQISGSLAAAVIVPLSKVMSETKYEHLLTYIE